MTLLQSQLSDDVLQTLSQQVGAPPTQTASAANGIFAALLGGLAGNAASSQNGLQSLVMALDRDHDGSILDDLGRILSNIANNDKQAASGALNGAGILSHILGDRQQEVAQQVSQSSGLSTQQVMRLLPLLAPVVMAVLGRARQSGQLDVGDLLQTLLGSAKSAQSRGYGDLIGSLLSEALSGQQGQQQGGGLLGSLLGGFLGKR